MDMKLMQTVINSDGEGNFTRYERRYRDDAGSEFLFEWRSGWDYMRISKDDESSVDIQLEWFTSQAFCDLLLVMNESRNEEDK